ncbi:MAG: hypothetical protein HA495_03815 [Thaumarchaeota archaeon]|nr:hypothetical protein [Nitrososphaerota archaeon]
MTDEVKKEVAKKALDKTALIMQLLALTYEDMCIDYTALRACTLSAAHALKEAGYTDEEIAKLNKLSEEIFRKVEEIAGTV